MGAQGTAVVNFGSFPGASDTSVAVTGQGAITGASLVEAWIWPTTSADHSADEHMLETLRVIAGNVSAGVGFTIYAFNESQIHEPLENMEVNRLRLANIIATGPYSEPTGNVGGKGTRIYGQWNVAWVWN